MSGKKPVVSPAFTALRSGLRRSLVLATAVSLAVNLLKLTLPLYILQVFDRVLTNRSEDSLLLLTATALGALVVLVLLDAVRVQVLARLGAWSEKRLGGDVYAASVVRAGLTGQASAQGLHDLRQVRNFLSGLALVPIIDAPWSPIFIAVIFSLHPILGWFALCGAMLLAAIVIVNEMVTLRLQTAASDAGVANTRAAGAGIRNADVIQAMGMLPNLVRRWQENDAVSVRLSRKAAGRSAALTALSKYFRMAMELGILGLGAWLVVKGDLGAGVMFAAFILLGSALAPVDLAAGAWRQTVQGLTAWERLRQLLDAMPGRREFTRLPVPKGELEVEYVTFAYPGQSEPVLTGITFELEPATTLAILGPSAAGKTTLARLLVGSLVPRFGTVRLDRADVSSCSAEVKMRDIGYLPQDIELFQGTVRDNIARMGEGADADVIEAARIAGAHEMILALPQGYDTCLGEDGVNLSGGQRQMVGLARAVFGVPRLVVLDEPNSNLDQEGEMRLLRAIVALKARGSVVIVVSHRPSVVQYVDQILVLKHGRVESFGSREEPLHKLVHPASTGSPIPVQKEA